MVGHGVEMLLPVALGGVSPRPTPRPPRSSRRRPRGRKLKAAMKGAARRGEEGKPPVLMLVAVGGQEEEARRESKGDVEPPNEHARIRPMRTLPTAKSELARGGGVAIPCSNFSSPRVPYKKVIAWLVAFSFITAACLRGRRAGSALSHSLEPGLPGA